MKHSRHLWCCVALCSLIQFSVLAQHNDADSLDELGRDDVAMFPHKNRRDPFLISATLLPQKKKPSTKKPDKQSAARKGATRRGLPEEHALTADEQSQKITQAKKFLAMLPALFEAQDYSGMRALAGRIQRALQEKFTLPDLDAQKQEILGKVDIAQRRARIHEDFLNRDITISAIIYEENARSVAIINGQSVEIGDSIGDDISVDAIHKNSVVFRYRGERIRKNF